MSSSPYYIDFHFATTDAQIDWTDSYTTVYDAQYLSENVTLRAAILLIHRDRQHELFTQKLTQARRTAPKRTLDPPKKLEEFRKIVGLRRRQVELDTVVARCGRVGDRLEWAERMAGEHEDYIWNMVRTTIGQRGEGERADGTGPLRWFLRERWREV